MLFSPRALPRRLGSPLSQRLCLSTETSHLTLCRAASHALLRCSFHLERPTSALGRPPPPQRLRLGGETSEIVPSPHAVFKERENTLKHASPYIVLEPSLGPYLVPSSHDVFKGKGTTLKHASPLHCASVLFEPAPCTLLACCFQR